MAVITVSREKGSQGTYIAEKVAQTLGYHFVDKSLMERILLEYGVVEFEDEYHTSPSFWTRFTARGERREIMMDILRRSTLALAQHGNVVMLGRGCHSLLHGFADVLNVRVQAPLTVRIKRVMSKEGFSEREQAERFIEETDEVRASFVRDCYGVRLDDASLYDLVVNTGKISWETAVDWLAQAVGALDSHGFGDAVTTGSIEQDSVLSTLISRELNCGEVHG